VTGKCVSELNPLPLICIVEDRIFPNHDTLLQKLEIFETPREAMKSTENSSMYGREQIELLWTFVLSSYAVFPVPQTQVH